jgi:hypothetical protein
MFGFFKRKQKICNHKWVIINGFVINKDDKQYIRECCVCSKCKISVHRKLHSFEELMRREEEIQNG